MINMKKLKLWWGWFFHPNETIREERKVVVWEFNPDETISAFDLYQCRKRQIVFNTIDEYLKHNELWYNGLTPSAKKYLKPVEVTLTETRLKYE